MKKFSVILILTVSLAFLAFGIGYAKKSGLLKAYPDAVYMDENITKTRIAYQNLDEKEKSVYTALYNGISQKSEYIELPCEVDGDTYEKIYFNIEKQEPEFFYLSGDFYTAPKIRTAQIIYRDNSETFNDKEMLLKAERNKILKNAGNSDNFDKLLYIHDYLAENCKYVESGIDYLETAYGCLVDKNANCEGYAKAFKYLCDGAEIPCVVTVGRSFDGSNHAWNQVKIDENWYNVDVTWDDCDDEFEKVHLYFLGSDDDFFTHFPDTELMPVFECNGIQKYYVKNNSFISTQDDAEKILTEKLQNIAENIELKFSGEYAYSQFKNVYMDNQRIFDILLENNQDVQNNEIQCLMKEFEKNYVIVLKLSKK